MALETAGDDGSLGRSQEECLLSRFVHFRCARSRFHAAQRPRSLAKRSLEAQSTVLSRPWWWWSSPASHSSHIAKDALHLAQCLVETALTATADADPHAYIPEVCSLVLSYHYTGERFTGQMP